MLFHYIVTLLYVLVCLVLLMVVLLQQGRGGDIASAFGGSSSQAAFGARAGATLLTRITTVTAVLFMLGAVLLGVIWQRGGGTSIMSGTRGAPASAPASPGPAKPAPSRGPSTPAPQPPPPSK